MNRKIFTLLASALMLFSTAFYASARSVADKSVGALVKTLPTGLSQGMYHIQVDSICLTDTVTGSARWYPVTYDGAPNGAADYFEYTGYNSPNPGLNYALVNRGTGVSDADTLVLSITEGGQVVMVSAPDLRNAMRNDDAGLTDLQATMWCTNVVKDPSSGQWPTFHFTNKIYNKDLDYAKEGVTTLVSERGWMYSNAYEYEQLNSKQPLYRHNEKDLSKGLYTVITAELNAAGRPTGKLYTKNVPIDEFVADTVVGMLKLSIMKISPFVLNAKDFNTQLYNTDGTTLAQLTFDPVPTQDNLFGYKLKAQETTTNDAKLGYLNVEAFDENGKSLGFIRNSNQSKTDDPDKYNNKFGTEYLNITAGKLGTSDVGTAKGSGYNYSYRFVYFPSEDSLVINAYHVKHDGHNMYGDAFYTDNDDYISDGLTPYYYGLYYNDMHYALIVRLQDLTGYDGVSSLMTIASHPSNVRIYFGINSCEEMLFDAWQPAKGVYTIWDSRGRCLGVRIYNGSYTPQWMELYEGECPDRIPAYQWVIEPAENSPWRVNIVNRELGNLAPEAVNDLVNMKNVLVYRDKSQIFKQQSQFEYSPIIPQYSEGNKYEPITQGWVTGQYLPCIDLNVSDNCGTSTGGKSGFRPVINEFLTDTFLGYKHFYVDKNTSSVSYGKSEDSEKGKGMDYNAYAFNYLHNYTEDGYINLKENYTDSLLFVDTKSGNKTGFQFMLGTYLRSHQYEEEVFGYPRGKDDDKTWKNLVIKDEAPYYNPNYIQLGVPTLKRYYYEMKVADFYEYRDGLAEQFVVLKGAKADNSDALNGTKYGVADVWADKDPFKFANVYLRESLFLPREQSVNEERSPQDPSRRIFYVLLDRVEAEQMEKLTRDFGFEVSDTLMGEDGTSKYSLVQVGVDNKDGWIKAFGKTGSSRVFSPFALENKNYPLYRRLRSTRDDNANEEGDGINQDAPCQLDAPKTLRVFRSKEPADYLFEDAVGDHTYGYGINFLGVANSAEYPEKYSADGQVRYNYHMFIDTAYINRGTGWIKPQYMFAVGQEVFAGAIIPGTDACGDPMSKELIPYVAGRYLVNATDSARVLGSDGSDVEPRDTRYIFDTNWDRLAFVPAIHTGDRLYIISELLKCGIKESEWTYTGEDGKKYVDGLALRDLADNDSRLAGKERKPENSSMYGAYYDFGTWNNYHNDVCFSLRFTHSDVENPDENGEDPVYTNHDKRFFIESETTNRTPYGNRKIAPVQGGWIKLQNWVPVLSRMSYEDAMGQAEQFNVELPTAWQDGEATPNDNLTGKVSVIAGEGSISVLNAAGKQVVISNMLGQTIVNKALVGNNETVSVSKGLVIVTVEGEKAVKVIIK
ncbi:MAG: DUF6383 domain-containing protein [Tannerella sp.]|jgi:hypothetical protein|nr:DUF6383 domain-containing protein [Tannerella sp.]